MVDTHTHTQSLFRYFDRNENQQQNKNETSKTKMNMSIVSIVKSRTFPFDSRGRIVDTSAFCCCSSAITIVSSSDEYSFIQDIERHHVNSLWRSRSGPGFAPVFNGRSCGCSGGSGRIQLRSHGPLCRPVFGEFQPYEQHEYDIGFDATDVVSPPPDAATTASSSSSSSV